MDRFIKSITLGLVCGLLIALGGLAVSAQKMAPADILAKHLDSIANAETRAGIKDMTGAGTVAFTVLRAGGTGGDGLLTVASEGNKAAMAMSFRMPSYQSEVIVFDGKKLRVDFVFNNRRSDLGDYIFRYPEVIKEGLFGGVLTNAWALRYVEEKKAKLSSKGIKKIDGKEYYALEYLKKGGSDTEITLFFDKDTFQHVRTDYRRLISASQGTDVNASSSRRERRENMTEEFSDFKAVNGVTLPHKYRIYVSLEGQAAGTLEKEWVTEFKEFYFNQKLDPATFNTSTNNSN